MTSMGRRRHSLVFDVCVLARKVCLLEASARGFLYLVAIINWTSRGIAKIEATAQDLDMPLST